MNFYGLDLPDLPQEWTPLEAAVVMKCLGADGTVRLVSRYTPGVSAWEALGMLRAEVINSEQQLWDAWRGGSNET